MADNDTLGTDTMLTMIRVNVLQAMFVEDTLPYCFGMYIKQEDAQLVQIHKVAGLLGVQHHLWWH